MQGQELFQADFTDAQYGALARLAATLMALFPSIPNVYPTGDSNEGVDRITIVSAAGAAAGAAGGGAGAESPRPEQPDDESVVPRKLPDEAGPARR